jgi:VanZ family protein
MGVIFLLSTDFGSAEHTSQILEPLLKFFFHGISAGTIGQIHFLVRKTAHLSVYAVLAILWWRALYQGHAEDRRRQPGIYALLALLIATVYAGTDEYHQSFVGSRTASLHDVMIDSCGALIGLAVVLVWRGFRNRVAQRG